MVLSLMREGAKSGISKILLFSLMVAAVFGLVVMDISAYFTGNVSSGHVAKIGNEKISAPEFDRTTRNILERQGVDAQTAYQLGMINQILNAQIGDHLMSRANHDAGLRVSDDVVAAQIKRLVAPYTNESVSARDALKRILANQGMTEAQFVEGLRAELGKTIIRNSLQLSSLYATEQEARDLNTYQNETRTVKAIYFPFNEVKNIGDAPEETLQSYYNAGKERYAIPETRSFTVAILSPSELQKSMNVSEDKLKDLYEQEKSSFTAPQRRVVEQALFDDEKAAQDVADKVKAKTSLKDAAKTSYLGTETFEQKGLAPEIASVAFAAKEGDVIGPVKTGLGWHVLVLKDIKEPAVKPYAEVKEQLRRDLLETQLSDKLMAVSGDIDDQLAGGSTLEEVSKSMKLMTKSYGPMRQNASDAVAKDFGKDQGVVIKTAFEIEEGESAPVIELSDGRYAVVRTDKVSEKTYKSFDDVKGDLKTIWVTERQQAINKEKTDAALKELQDGQKTLEQVASANGLSIKSYSLKRAEEAAEPFTSGAKDKFFGTAKGGYTVTAVNNGLIIGQVESISLPNAAQLPADKVAQAQDVLAKQAANDTMDDYLNFLSQKYNVKINQKMLEKIYAKAPEETQ